MLSKKLYAFLFESTYCYSIGVNRRSSAVALCFSIEPA